MTGAFTIRRRGFFCPRVRLESSAPLTPDDFQAVADSLNTSPRTARKVGIVAARLCEARERVETRWNGKESENTAEPGDWIVTTLTSDEDPKRDRDGHVNTYVIKPDKFAQLYEPTDRKGEFGEVFTAKGIVKAVYLSGGFDISAPWGEQQLAPSGYLLLNGSDVYGNAKEIFEATYEFSG